MKQLLVVFFCGMICSNLYSTDNEILTGADKDQHGCIGSAGYTWSELHKECIRIWETGIPLYKAKDKTKAMYVVFVSDQSAAELFFPDGKRYILLRDKSQNSVVYKGGSAQEGTLSQKRRGWQYVVNGKREYSYR